MKFRLLKVKYIWFQCQQNLEKMSGLSEEILFWSSPLKRGRKSKQKFLPSFIVIKLNTFRAKANGRVAFWSTSALINYFILFYFTRPKEFDSVPSPIEDRTIDNDPDVLSTDSDSSSGNDDDLFVNTNRPQCLYESSDSSDGSESDSNTHEDNK